MRSRAAAVAAAQTGRRNRTQQRALSARGKAISHKFPCHAVPADDSDIVCRPRASTAGRR
jgi:hypothetical protein